MKAPRQNKRSFALRQFMHALNPHFDQITLIETVSVMCLAT